jgi:hypothetical protein
LVGDRAHFTVFDPHIDASQGLPGLGIHHDAFAILGKKVSNNSQFQKKERKK